MIAGLSGVLALVINVVISHFIWYRSRPFTVFPKGTYTELVPHTQMHLFQVTILLGALVLRLAPRENNKSELVKHLQLSR